MGATVEIREEDGEYTAVDGETGITGVGDTKAIALAELAVRLDAEGEGEWNDAAKLKELSARISQRFDEEGVTEADVADAIAWARSE